ncbi:MAG: helix-turn-helix domain-containing protein [Hyphomicrobiaceae bacterium]
MPVVGTLPRALPRLVATSLSIACDTCAVRDRSICAMLTRDELLKLNSISQFKEFASGQPILRDGEQQTFFATVVTGAIKLTKSLSDGRQQIVGLQFPSDFLGRPWRLASPYDATAATDVKICLFSRAKFEDLTKSHPGLGHRLLAHTLDDLDAAQEWLLLLGRKTASEKVATLLELMMKRLAPPSPAGANQLAAFDLPLTRAEMADCLGLTLETVCRKMTDFKTVGVIEVRDAGRSVQIRDVAKLRRASGSLEP